MPLTIQQMYDLIHDLIASTPWPDDEQGVVAQIYAWDVLEFCVALMAEANEQRWSVCHALFRPLQERWEHMLAASINVDFATQQINNLRVISENKEPIAGRPRAGEARGIIARWEESWAGTSGLDHLIDQAKVGSSFTHPNLFAPAKFPGMDSSPEVLAVVRQMVLMQFHLALLMTIPAIAVLEAHDTDAWRLAVSGFGLLVEKD